MNMKRNAGDWLRSKMNEKAYLILTGIGISGGLGIGVVLFAVLPPLIGHRWSLVACAALSAVCLIVVIYFERSKKWNLENLMKGENAERRVAQCIEYAITAEDCAVAHSVTHQIAEYGDIDHLVATPAGLWVIETKYQHVLESKFRETLERIAANVKTVREWAPTGTPVRGCLVLAYENKKYKKTIYDKKEEKIFIYTQNTLDTLTHKIREEARKTKGSRDLAKQVRKLGKLEAIS